MSGLKCFSGFAVSVIVFAAAPLSALADHRDGPYRPRADVDLDSLSGRLYYAPDDWKLHVKYEVEVEDAYGPESFDLILYVTDHGHPVLDQNGRPIQIVVPLDRPTEVDDDEMEFEGRIIVSVPHCSDSAWPRLRLRGVVVRSGDGFPLDHKERKVSFRDRRPRLFHTSFSVWN